MDTARSFGYRQLSILMIIVASWILDRYRSLKELEGMGESGFDLGFVVALYAVELAGEWTTQYSAVRENHGTSYTV